MCGGCTGPTRSTTTSLSSKSGGTDRKATAGGAALWHGLRPCHNGKRERGRVRRPTAPPDSRWTMKRLRDFSIKARLYLLVAVVVVGFTTVLGITFWLSSRYQVNGPLYNRLMLRKTIMAEYEPASLALVQPNLTLNTMLIAKDKDELGRLEEQ